MRNVIFQQDGATCHTTPTTLNFILEWLQKDDVQGDENKPRLISLKSSFPWPARSPDLSACDFFLWGYLKHHCYLTPPRNAEQLLQRIEEHCRNLEENQNLFSALQ